MLLHSGRLVGPDVPIWTKVCILVSKGSLSLPGENEPGTGI
jgi:hypothetical protein